MEVNMRMGRWKKYLAGVLCGVIVCTNGSFMNAAYAASPLETGVTAAVQEDTENRSETGAGEVTTSEDDTEGKAAEGGTPDGTGAEESGEGEMPDGTGTEEEPAEGEAPSGTGTEAGPTEDGTPDEDGTEEEPAEEETPDEDETEEEPVEGEISDETEDDESEAEAGEAEPVVKEERSQKPYAYVSGRTASERAASSAQIREINLGFYGMQSPEPADGTSYWKGSRVSFGEVVGQMLNAGNLGLNTQVYDNTWKVLDPDRGLLWADVNQIVNGVSTSAPWEDSDLYAYLNGADYKQNAKYFKDADRQAILEVTLLSEAELTNTAYGFTNDVSADKTRHNGGTDEIANVLLPVSDGNQMLLWDDGSIGEMTDASLLEANYGCIPALYLDTSRVLYSMINQPTGYYDSAKLTAVENLGTSDAPWELVMKSDDTGFAAELPDSVAEGGTLSVNVTATGAGDYQYTVAMLTDSTGTVAAYAKSETVTVGTVSFPLSENIAPGTYHLTVFEESAKWSNTWGATSSYASNVIEKDIKVTGMEIADLQVCEQTYGSVKLYWELANIPEFGEVTCWVYRSETEDGTYEKIDEVSCAWGSPPTSFEPVYVWEDTAVPRAEGTGNKTYYYKVCIVNEDGTEGFLTEAVTNADMYYGIKRTETLEYDYVGAYITDAEGQKLEELRLRKGESKELRLVWVNKDGTVKTPDRNCARWYLFDEYCMTKNLDNNPPQKVADSVMQILPVELAKPNDSAIDFINYKVKISALSGAMGDTCYLTVSMYDGEENASGYCYWQIPVHIVEGEADPGESGDSLHFYRTKAEFSQAVRDEMVNRTKEFTFYVKEEDDAGWWPERDDAGDPYGDIFDFYREREGIKPNEGDYLELTRGKAGEVSFIDEWLAVDSAYFDGTGSIYHKYVFTPSFITTKAQEDWVDSKIDEIIYRPGGALYPYRNASDYDKIKAAYDYVRQNVGYKGTPDPIYHTCYSALYHKQATCQGYALLFYRLARELGIPARVLMGTDANAHTYNIVRFGNNWYYLDTNAGVFLCGEKEFNHTTLQSQYLVQEIKDEYLSKIPDSSYEAGQSCELQSVRSLTDEEIKALDSHLQKTSSRMSAQYAVSGGAIKATGTLKYVAGCSGYLGYQAQMPTSGYFLALKVKADPAKLTDEGYLCVSFPAGEGKREKVYYRKTQAAQGDRTLAGGSADFIIRVTDYTDEVTITIDYDGEDETSDYQPNTYHMDFSGLKLEEQQAAAGDLSEAGVYGIEPSSPLFMTADNGSVITARYEAVAYSANVTLPDKDARSGHYVALKLSVPESIKGTVLALEKTTVRLGDEILLGEGKTGASDCYVEAAADYSYLLVIMPIAKGDSKELVISWGGADTYAHEQHLVVEATADCLMESRNENAVLPGSIEFNGLNKTMYVGQSQAVHVTINKKYERDITQLIYRSGAGDIVQVNRITGVMKAIKPGTAEITVSAVDKAGNTIAKSTRTATITVKNVTAPAGIKAAAIKDTNVTISWKANATGQYMEVYAVPLSPRLTDAKPAQWKDEIESALKRAGMNGKLLKSLGDEDKKQVLQTVESSIGVGSCQAEYAKASDSRLTITGLQPETAYVFYVRNASETAVSSVAFSGAVSGKVTTKKVVFATVTLTALAGDGTNLTAAVSENGMPLFTVTGDQLAASGAPVKVSYKLMNENGEAIDAEFKSVKFITDNKNVVKVDKAGQISLGNQAGEARLYVTGKDSSGTLRESDSILIRVIKKPSALANKTVKLALGQSIPIRECIGVNVKGSVDAMDLREIDFDAALKEIRDTGCFEISGEEGAAEDAVITAAALIENNGVRKSGNSVSIGFGLRAGTAAEARTATIKINDMRQPVIKNVTVRDTSAILSFTPSETVKEVSGSKYYYTIALRDVVTEEVLPLTDLTAGAETAEGYTCRFAKDAEGKLFTCELTGLSSNKAYEATLTAHYDADAAKRNTKASKVKKFVTSKPLLTSGGDIDVRYIGLEELRKDPNATGEKIDYDNEDGIFLENNGTYVFMAQVSNLARTLETDKLKWTISSGDNKIAKIKAGSSTFEMQLTAAKTGTFTVTAVSTVTKQAVSTFKVTIIPYQSNSRTPQENTEQMPEEVVYLPAEAGCRFGREEDEPETLS